MTSSTAANCSHCGALIPHGAGASASDACPACGETVDPDVTLHPGPAPAAWPPAAPPIPTRLPVGLLVGLAVSCALMGVALGVWLGTLREAPPPEKRSEVRLPALPPPAPAYDPPMPPPRFYPRPANPRGAPPLPPPRVAPPGRRQATDDRRRSPMRWPRTPAAPRAGASSPITRSAGARPVSPPARPPLKAKGMATVRVTNPSERRIEVTLSGRDRQVGVVAPRAVMDFLVPPGRYDVALKGTARAQRFSDAPLAEGEVLALVYAEGG